MDLRRAEKFLFFFIGDALLIAIAMIIAFLLRFDGHIPMEYYSRLPFYIAFSIGITLPIFLLRKLYAFTWSFVSVHELIEVLEGVVISGLIFTAGFVLMKEGPLFAGFPRSVLVLHFGITFLLIGFLRTSKRLKAVFSSQKAPSSTGESATLIIGADELAEQLIRTLLQGGNEYRIVGILDDMTMKQNTYLHGIPVIGRIADITDVAVRYGIQTVIIALPSTKREVIRNVLRLARSANVKDIRIIPGMLELLSGEASIQQLRPVKVEDLLGREQAKIDTAEIEFFLKGKDVLITGAAGSIGSELARQVSKFSPHSLHLLDYEESNLFSLMQNLQNESPQLNCRALVADIRNGEKIKYLMEHIRPQVIFHAAAYKHVPLMETFPEEGVATNVFGTLSVYQAALSAGVEKVVLISTDKAVRPKSVMGQTKKVAEMLTQAFNGEGKTQFVAVRFGNVLRSRGSVIPTFEKQLREGGPLTVTDSRMTRFFMTAPEAVLLVMEAGAIGHGGEIFVLDMGEPVKIVDLAKELIRLSGLEPGQDVDIVFTQPRPGEKLSEEVLTAEEGTTVTHYQKICRVKTSFSMKLPELILILDQLKRAIVNPEELRRKLAEFTMSAPTVKTIASFNSLINGNQYQGIDDYNSI